MDRTDRILEIAFGTMPPDQLIALGATMDDVAAANDLLLMDAELEKAPAVREPTAAEIFNAFLRRLRDP
jgi:hypothetical protein